MNRSAKSIQDRFNALREAYRRRLPEHLDQVAQAAQSLRRGEWDQDTLRNLYSRVHHLVGSGATFGYTAVSRTARELENLLSPGLESSDALTFEQRRRILGLLSLLRQACVEASQNGDAVRPEGGEGEPAQRFLLPERVNRPIRRQIFLVEDDLEQAQYLAMLVEQAGYSVRLFTCLDAFKQAFLETSPAATIISMVFAEGDLAGAEVITELRRSRLLPLPVIFTSARDDITAQLGAVHARGKYYFTKPVNAMRLMQALEDLTAPLCRAQVQELIEQAVREVVGARR